MKSVHDIRRDGSAFSTRNHQFSAPFRSIFINSRRPGITYEYILRSAGAGGGHMEQPSPFDGDNDGLQV